MQTPSGQSTHQGARRTVGRYALYDRIATGGMASVFLGRLNGPAGFSKTVAIKQMHAHLAGNQEFVGMFLDEVRIVSRIQHPNVVGTIDVIQEGNELFIVMELVQGESLATLFNAARIAAVTVDPRIAAAIALDLLHGLHAAHEACDEHGFPLGVVHRDVSPHNIMVGTDGISRVLDFGVAKARGRLQSTSGGQLKGKVAYMAPEQLGIDEVDRRVDVYASAAVLWEALAGRRLVHGAGEGAILARVQQGGFPPPSTFARGVSSELDAIVMKALETNPAARFPTARDFAMALERTVPSASRYEVAAWVQSVSGDTLARRAERVRLVEATGPSGRLEHTLAPASPPASGPELVSTPASGPALVSAPASGPALVALEPTRAAPLPPKPLSAAGEQSSGSASGSSAYAHVGPPPGAAPSRVRLGLALALAVVFAVVGVTLGVVGIYHRRHATPRASATEAPSAAEPTTVAAPPPVASTTAPPTDTAPPASVEAAGPLSTASTSSPSTHPAAPPKPGAKAAHSGPAGSEPKKDPKKDCAMPFYVGPDGLKHVKPECM
jgi:eukaryotic-like serine/threonine-protein kinase